jgi:hypothetical protein
MQHNDGQHDDTQHNGLLMTLSMTVSTVSCAVMLLDVMLSVAFFIVMASVSLVSSSSSEIDHSPRYPKVEGSSPAKVIEPDLTACKKIVPMTPK